MTSPLTPSPGQSADSGQSADPGQGLDPGQSAASAADKAQEHHRTVLCLPLVGEVSLPAPQHLAWYAGVGLLAVAGIVEWPIAVVLAVGKALSDSSRNSALKQFGEALDEGV